MEYHHRHMEVPSGVSGVSGAGSQPAPHWGYPGSGGGGGGGGWGAPAPAPRASKRVHSESDDCDDVFSEESSKDATSPGEGGGGGGDSCQLMTRKRRRGVIEKKRRDRINTSLTELKRLVPSAYEKQGSAKLEKAEILQLTVDHLKMLHAKGLDTFAYDPQRYAMDYHSVGFRECASEVARYLVSCEGLDIQDPLRLRLMSHLQCFAAQRELAAKSCSNPWGYSGGAQYGHAPPPAPAAALHHPHPHPPPPAAPVTELAPSAHHVGNLPSSHHDPAHSGYADLSRLEPAASTASSASASASAAAAGSLAPLTTLAPSVGYPPPHYAAHPYPAPYHHPPPPPGHQQYNHNSSKPYRPWGAELAY